MNGVKMWLLWEDKIWTIKMFSVLEPQTWLMCCFFQENPLHHIVTHAAGEKSWCWTQRGSLVTSTFGWDPHHWLPHLGLIRSELARSWTHRSEGELKEADRVGVLWRQASTTLSAWNKFKMLWKSPSSRARVLKIHFNESSHIKTEFSNLVYCSESPLRRPRFVYKCRKVKQKHPACLISCWDAGISARKQAPDVITSVSVLMDLASESCWGP